MSELLDKQKLVGVSDSESERDWNDSASDIDEDGYDNKDPYSAMAGKINKRNKAVIDYHNRPLTKATKMIIDNKDNMTYFEKHLMKYICCFGLLGYLLYTNLSNPVEITDARAQKYKVVTAEKSFFD